MFRPLLVLSLLLLTATASAAPRDAAAKKKIDEAINKHYVVAAFDQAEAMLLGAISACGGQCSSNVVAKAWMYVGVVRGGGKNNQKGAKEAFINALMADPGVPLDDALATPATRKTFLAAQKEVGATGARPTGAAGASADTGGGSGVECSLKVTQVQTRRPIPVSCSAPENAKKVELRYRAGREEWKKLPMKSKNGAYRATIPCSATQKPGTLRWYVRAEDENGDPVGGVGKKSSPEQLRVVKRTEEEPPAFPDEEAPRRCPRAEGAGAEDEGDEGQSDDDGGEDEGKPCESSDECDEGQRCVEGICEARKKKKKKKGDRLPPNWFGLHFAYDFAIVSGEKVCSVASQRDEGFACFYQDTEEQYRFEPHPRYANSIQGGLAPATARVLLSFERLLVAGFGVGLRAGYAFNGGPPSGSRKEFTFLPYHLELRASYTFGDSASFALPYAGLQAGAAQVDAKLLVSVGDCGGTPGGPPSQPGAQIAQDATYYNDCTQGRAKPVRLDLDAYKKLGKGFVGLHGGAIFLVTPKGGIQLDLSLKQMLPTTGQVIEPSLGWVQGM